MVTIKGLIRTVSIVKNPFTLLNMKLRGKSAKVTLNGAVFQVTLPQLFILKDNYDLVKKWQIQQINDETFKVTTDNYQLVGSHNLVDIVIEMELGKIYDYDYQDKIVLDIGGFQGETAAFFWSKGAKKIVIYEPVLEHHLFINENICLNKINAESYSEGIGDRDGERVVTYDKTDWGFGLETQQAQNKMNIKIRDVSKVIVESGADVAKFDCEGAEISLISVPTEILRKLEYVIVEFHTPQIRQQLLEKFKRSAFTVVRDNWDKNTNGSLVHLKRMPDMLLSAP